jgi:hypothetical protein
MNWSPSVIIGNRHIYKGAPGWRVVERLSGLKNVVATIGEVDVKRCEEGREGSDVMTSCTPQCRNLTKHIVRGYRRRKSRKLPKQGMQRNVKERGKSMQWR